MEKRACTWYFSTLSGIIPFTTASFTSLKVNTRTTRHKQSITSRILGGGEVVCYTLLIN